MEEPKRKKYQKLISEHLQTVKEDIANLKELTKPISPDNAIGRLSRMEAIAEKSVNEANLRKFEIRLQRLEHAAKLVETEEYGYCQVCDEPIPEKRLQILPESLTCIGCLQQSE